MGKWKVVLFTDIFVDVTSKATKIPKENYLEQGNFQIIDQGKSDIAGYTNEHSGLFTETPAIVFGDHTRILKYVDKPLFIGADGVKLLRSKISNVNYRYLYYVLCSVHIENTGYNRHFKWLKKSEIPLPPLEEQKRISQNLDLANKIVKGYKEQLAELDKLVQSVFYEMFGDPVTNEKGWEVKKLREIYRVGSSKRIYQSEQEATGVPFLRISDLVKRINTGLSDADLYISPVQYETLKSKSLVPEPNDILVTARGTLGLCYIVKKTDKFYFQDGMISWLHKKNLDVQSKYIATLFSNTIFRRNFDKIQTGTTVPYLSIAQLSEFNIIFPPFMLQTTFASIVTEIEAHKEQVKQALTEAENLFNSLMQEYFE